MTNENNALNEWLTTIGSLLDHMPSLRPSEEWDAGLDAVIEALSVERLGAEGKERMIYGQALKAGLHLMNESLDRSHTISQEITNSTGSYWHGLMHRMEGDYSNAKYWFADAGQHFIHAQLIADVRNIVTDQDLAELEHEGLRSKLGALRTSPVWNSSVFVDAVQLQVTLVQNSKAEEWLLRIQQCEMKLLMQYCYEKSCGGSLLEEIARR